MRDRTTSASPAALLVAGWRTPRGKPGNGTCFIRAEVADEESRLMFLQFVMDYFGMTTRRFD